MDRLAPSAQCAGDDQPHLAGAQRLGMTVVLVGEVDESAWEPAPLPASPNCRSACPASGRPQGRAECRSLARRRSFCWPLAWLF
jgi:hypothetical protein